MTRKWVNDYLIPIQLRGPSPVIITRTKKRMSEHMFRINKTNVQGYRMEWKRNCGASLSLRMWSGQDRIVQRSGRCLNGNEKLKHVNDVNRISINLHHGESRRPESTTESLSQWHVPFPQPHNLPSLREWELRPSSICARFLKIAKACIMSAKEKLVEAQTVEDLIQISHLRDSIVSELSVVLRQHFPHFGSGSRLNFGIGCELVKSKTHGGWAGLVAGGGFSGFNQLVGIWERVVNNIGVCS